MIFFELVDIFCKFVDRLSTLNVNMTKLTSLLVILLAVTNVFGANRYWVANSAGNWNSTSNWSTSSGGAGGASVPGPGDFIYFNANGLGNCNLDVNAAFDGITISGYTGVIDLNGFSFDAAVSGSANCTFASGTINDTPGTSEINHTSTLLTRFSGTTFGATININSNQVDFDGGIFNAPVTVHANGNGSTNGNGGCTFNSTFTATNSGTGYFLMGQTNPDIFNGVVTLTNTSTSRIRIAYAGTGHQFNDNIIVENTGGGVWFGENSGASTLADSRTISIGPLGYSSNTLRIQNMIQVGNTPQNITLSGTARLFLNTGTVFNADVNFAAPQFTVQGSTFNGTAILSKTGASSNASAGGNTFNDHTTINNSGTGYFLLGNGSPDIFAGNLTLNNTGDNNIYIGHNSAGNTIGGDLIINNLATGNGGLIYISTSTASTVSIAGDLTLIQNSPGTSSGTYIGNSGSIDLTGDLEITELSSGSSTVSIAVSDTVNIGGALTYTNTATGNSNFYMADNAVSQLIISDSLGVTNNSSGSTTRMYIGDEGDLQINSNVNCVNGAASSNSQIIFSRTTSSKTTIQGNTFIDNSGTGTNSIYYLGNSGDMTYNGTLTILNSSSANDSRILCNHATNSHSDYNDHVVIESSNAGSDGVLFGAGGGSADLATTKTLTIGPGGFVAGQLYLRNFTQPDNIAHTFIGTGTAYIYLYDSDWTGNVDFRAPRMYTRGTVYRGTAYLEKTGGIGDDYSYGGNMFMDDVDIVNSGSRSLIMGGSSADTCMQDLTLLNTGTRQIGFAYGSSGNLVMGDLTSTNNGVDGNAHIYVCTNGTAASLSVEGNCTVTNNGSGSGTQQTFFGNTGTLVLDGNFTGVNNGSGTAGNLYLGNAANVTVGGDCSLTNNGTANNQIIVASSSTSSVDFGGNTTVVNADSSNSKRIYLGNYGDITFNGTLSITNASQAANSQIYCNYRVQSTGIYNENIILESTASLSDGIRFGEANGNATLASTKTITIGAGGYDAGLLYLRNFTQVGPTAQTLNTTGTAYIYNYDSNWGGDVDFRAPRMNTRGTRYNGTSYIEKTGGIADDNCTGGNFFTGNTDLVNTGSRRLGFGWTVPDTCLGDVNISNTGSQSMIFAYNSTGNYIGGDLTITNTPSGTSPSINVGSASASTLTVDGNCSITNTPTSTGTSSVYFGNAGTHIIGGDLTMVNSGAANSQTLIANSSTADVTINGNTSISNSGGNTLKRIYLGNYGDVTYNGTLDITNASDVTNSEIYCNNYSQSSANYNENITVECTVPNSDGIFFGSNTGTGVLASGKSVSIGAGGFISGNLRFRNFTQLGNTTHSLNATGTTLLYQYDSEWGGDVNFSAPRVITRGTVYNGTAYIEKTGGIADDGSSGGNIFSGNTQLVNTGSRDFNLSITNPDTCLGNLTLSNIGTADLIYAYNSVGNLINGDLTILNSGTGNHNYLYLGYTGSPTVNVTGNLSATNSGSPVNNGNIYIGSNGTLDIAGDATVTNVSTGTNGYVYFGNSATVNLTGNCDLINGGTGNNLIYLANGTASSIDIDGNVTVLNDNTNANKTVYLGHYGDITIDGTLTMSNKSPSATSYIYCNDRSNSTGLYHENIVVESTHTNADGIYFGRNGGNATLAAGKTVSIGAGGYVAGLLQFRNFTQTGPTAQTLNATGTAYIYNYDSDWGGDVDFRAPRMNTRGTLYNGTAYLEKTGGIADDNSAGGNTFTGNAELVNNGSTQFLMGNGSPDTFLADLDITNSGSDHFYLAYNSAGNSIAGNLNITQSNTGTYGIVSLSNSNSSSLTIGGTTDYNLTSGSNDSRFYLGNSGDITFDDDVTITYNSSGNNSYGYLATGSTSNAIINGNLTLTHTAPGTTKRMYIANSGDLTLNGDLSVTQSSSATNATVSLCEGTSSSATISGVTNITNTGGANEKRIYLGQNGDVTFNDDLTILNSASANSSQIYCNNGSNSSNSYLGNILLENSDSAGDGVYFGGSGGQGVLANGRNISIGAGGFVAGNLYFRNFTQTGGTSQTLMPTGTTTFQTRTSEWNGNVTFTAPRMYTTGTTFNGTTYLEKTGANSDASAGSNTFNDTTILRNSGTGYFMPANGTGNDFNADVTYIKANTGLMYPSYNSVSTYSSDITVESSTVIVFGAAGNGRAVLDGNTPQSISATGASPAPSFRDLQTLNLSDDITLNTPITILTELDLDEGNLISSDLNLIVMNDNSTVSSVSDNAFVDGPLEKIGNDIFTFPVGKSDRYRPIEISTAPSSSSARFKGEFFPIDPVDDGYLDYKIPSTINHVSDCEYWILDRTNSTSNVNVRLYYEDYASNDCSGVLVQSELVVARWDDSLWVDHGNGGFGGTPSDGWVETAGLVTDFSPFTLASTTINNPLPVELVNFDVYKKIDHVEIKWETASEVNNDYFEVEKSTDGIHFSSIDKQNGAVNSSKNIKYIAHDYTPDIGLNYYRLKQVDLDGTTEYSDIKSVLFESESPWSFSPNPTNGQITLNNINLSSITALNVYDEKGKVVISTDQITDKNLDFSHLQSGIYYIQIIQNSGVKTLPMVIL